MKRILVLLIFPVSIISCNQENTTETPESIEYSLYFGENKAGYLKSFNQGSDQYHFILEYNDRGRGPHLEETIELDEDGLPKSIQTFLTTVTSDH